MIALLTIAAAFALFHVLVLYASHALGIEYWALVVCYFIWCTCVDHYDLQHMPWLRGSRLTKHIARWLINGKFVVQPEVWESIVSYKRPKMFVCGPHGIACSHLVSFAAYAGHWPDSVGARTRVVAHWIYLCIPLVRNIYTAYGVIDSRRSSIVWALERGDNVALCACGLIGKCQAVSGYRVVLDSTTKQYKYVVPTRDGRGAFEDGTPAVNYKQPELFPVVLQRSSTRLGCFALAMSYGAPVFTVLSPHEDEAYYRMAPWIKQHAPQWASWLVLMLVPLYGTWLVRQVRPNIEYYVGEGARYGPPSLRYILLPNRECVSEFANIVYDNFAKSAAENLYGMVYDWDKTISTQHSTLSVERIMKKHN